MELSIVGVALAQRLLDLWKAENYPAFNGQSRDIPQPVRIYDYLTSEDGADLVGTSMPSIAEIGARPAWSWVKIDSNDASRYAPRHIRMSGGAYLWITMRQPLYGSHGKVFDARLSNGWNERTFTRAINRLLASAMAEAHRMVSAEVLYKAWLRVPNKISHEFIDAAVAEEQRSGLTGSFTDMDEAAAAHWLKWLETQAAAA